MNDISSIALDRVSITDPLFGRYVRLVAEKILPYQWEALNDRVPGTEKSHCLDNFRVAAGDLPGRHQGAIFQDTDLYKWLEAVAYCIANGTGTLIAAGSGSGGADRPGPGAGWLSQHVHHH